MYHENMKMSSAGKDWLSPVMKFIGSLRTDAAAKTVNIFTAPMHVNGRKI